MLSFMTRRFAVIAALLAAFTLAGCGDKEPEQRKAFIEFLQTRIVNSKTLSVPILSAETKEKLGPYIDHYQVIASFNDEMTKTMEALKASSDLQSKLKNMQGVRDNWKEIANLQEAMKSVIPALDAAEKKADAARAALKQPDDLKAVYDQAYAKMVTDQAGLMKPLFPAAIKTMGTMAELGRFLDDNRAKMKISGMMIDSDDAALLKQFQTLQNTYMKEAQDLMKLIQPIAQKTGQRMPF